MDNMNFDQKNIREEFAQLTSVHSSTLDNVQLEKYIEDLWDISEEVLPMDDLDFVQSMLDQIHEKIEQAEDFKQLLNA